MWYRFKVSLSQNESSRCGGIGRRAVFRSLYGYPCASSTLANGIFTGVIGFIEKISKAPKRCYINVLGLFVFYRFYIKIKNVRTSCALLCENQGYTCDFKQLDLDPMLIDYIILKMVCFIVNDNVWIYFLYPTN